MGGLFEIPPELLPAAPRDPDGSLSEGRARTKHHLRLLGMGMHPITLRSLHADSTSARTVEEKSRLGLRCDSCAFLERAPGGFLKCGAGAGQFVTHSAATDVRRWWPACVLYEPSTTS